MRGPLRLSGIRTYLAIAMSVGCAVVLFAEMRRRHALYWYDVTADYRFEFSGHDVQRFRVRLSAGRFTMPRWEGAWQTALLRLTIEPALLGAWFEPALAVETPSGALCRQYFERRAAGQRYVNLCLDPDGSAPGTMARLVGAHVRWDDQDAELLLFRNPLPPTPRLLVLAPHADDAEIAAFGLYAHRDSWVATITNGSYGGAAYGELVADRIERDSIQADLRLWDSMAVPLWAGLTPDRSINLGYFALELQAMYHDRKRVVSSPVSGSSEITPWRRVRLPSLTQRPAVSTWENLVGDLSALLAEIQPNVVVAPHPALDANRDHTMTTVALLEALERLGDPQVQLLLYTNHHVDSEYYPFGPADAVVTLPPWVHAALPVRSVLSYGLDRRAQVAKLFALDAMHDLRPPPEPLLGSPTDRTIHRISRAVAGIVRDPAGELSYFRRAVRPNELFFAYTSGDRRRLQQLIPAP